MPFRFGFFDFIGGTALLSVAFSGLSLGRAQAQSRPEPSQTAPKERLPTTAISVKADARLSPNNERFGVKLAFLGQGFAVSSCTGLCKESSFEEVFSIPEEAMKLPRSARVVQLREPHEALWVRYGNDDDHYSIVIMGAPKTESETVPSTAPVVAFRGWSHPQKDRLSVHHGSNATDLYVLGADQPILCGRSLPASSRRLDPETGHFVPVRLPPLGSAERREAEPLPVQEFKKSERDVLLHLGTSLKMGSLSDGRRDGVWEGAHLVQSIPMRSWDSEMDWVIELEKPLKESAALYLITDRLVRNLTLLPHNGRFYSLAVPKEVACAVLIQSSDAAPLVEIWGHVVAGPPPTAAALIAQLNTADPGWAPAALVAMGSAGEVALTRAYPRLSQVGKRNALTVAVASPWGASTLAAALDVGPDEQADPAERALLSRGQEATVAVSERLERARPKSVSRLSNLLFELDNERGAQTILQGMGHKGEARRQGFRDTFTRLFASTPTREIFERLLFEQKMWGDLNRMARINIVRSVSDQYDLGLIGPSVLALGKGASFEEAYLLARPLAARLPILGSAKMLRSWLTGSGLSSPSPIELAAMRVHVTAQLLEVAPEQNEEFKDIFPALLDDPNMRVRVASAAYLARYPEAKGLSGLSSMLRKDPWPEARAQAATALGGLIAPDVSKLSTSQAEDIQSLLIRRARKDEQPVVRRASIRALTKRRGDDALDMLRRSLDKDESYEVRREAALALGRLCDAQSIDDLTKIAHKLASGELEKGPFALSLAAITALVQLAPSDLEKRLAPLLTNKIPRKVRDLVSAEQMAVSRTCSGSATGKH